MCSAYDRAAIKFRGVEADINFNIEDYEEDLKQVSEWVSEWPSSFPNKQKRSFFSIMVFLNLSWTVLYLILNSKYHLFYFHFCFYKISWIWGRLIILWWYVEEQMSNLTKEEFVHVLRRQSTGFPRGSSKYRGVTLHKCGRWEARMGQFLGKK